MTASERQPGSLSVDRRALIGGGAAVASATVLGFRAAGADLPALIQNAATLAEPDDGFIEPPVLRSEDGTLTVTLQAMQEAESSGDPALTFNSLLPGPTLGFRPGDTVQVAFVNAMAEMTNMHVHGLHVSPRDNSDNVFVHVQPGQTFGYEFRIPASHHAGTYWYHPHPHGTSAEQVGKGLAGAIIIEGGLDELEGIAGLRERLLVLQGPFDGPGNQPRNLVNGRTGQVIPIAPGETQRWRIANASANRFYHLQLAGHPLHLIAVDGNPLPERRTVDRHLLGPGERCEVLVQGGDPGIYELRSLAWAPDIPPQSQDQVTLATVVVGGDPVEPQELPTSLISPPDMSNDEIAARRTITFMVRSDEPVFAIDDKAFVEDRVDQVVRLGTTEEWTLRNESDEWHPFHIHVNDFQLMSVNGEPQPLEHHDTALIPPRGEIVVRHRFEDFTGRFVYHCHILVHEDNGMMGVIEVVDEDA